MKKNPYSFTNPHHGRWWLGTALAVLLITAGITAPTLNARLGPDRTVSATTPTDGSRITILGAGDILVHPPTWAQAQMDSGTLNEYDFDKILSRLQPAISTADLSLCHMEAPMGPGAPRDFPRFNAPISLAKTVRGIGFDGCSTASNHSLDQGPAGLAASLKALDDQGLKHTGTARNPKEALAPTIYNVKGVKVGHLSYAYGLNAGTAVPPGKKWMSNILGDGSRVIAAARRLKAAGADIVIVSAHWGIEKQHQINAQQRQLARLFLESPDIDGVIGHHAHVVQAAEKISGKWVFYGVGNLLARHDFPIPDNKEGILPRFTFERGTDGKYRTVKAEAVPIWLGIDPRVRVFNVAHSIAVMSDADRRRYKYRDAYDRIQKWLGARGAFRDGLVYVEPADQ